MSQFQSFVFQTSGSGVQIVLFVFIAGSFLYIHILFFRPALPLIIALEEQADVCYSDVYPKYERKFYFSFRVPLRSVFISQQSAWPAPSIPCLFHDSITERNSFTFPKVKKNNLRHQFQSSRSKSQPVWSYPDSQVQVR